MKNNRMFVVIRRNFDDYNVCAVTQDEEKAKKLTKYFDTATFDEVWYESFYPEWDYEGLDDLTQIWYVRWSDIFNNYIYRIDHYHHGPDVFVNDFYYANNNNRNLVGKSGLIGCIAAKSKDEAIKIYEEEWERREQFRIEYEQNHKKHRFTYDEVMPGVQVQSGVEEIKEEKK